MFQNRTSLISSSSNWVGAGTTTSTASPGTDVLGQVNLIDSKAAVFTAVVDATTPSAKQAVEADWNATTNVVTEAAHGFVTGLVGQLTTTNTLPAGLSLATNYYIIALTSGTYSLASSLANALAGTAIDFTNDGTGDHTFTPTTFAGTLKLQGSIDDGATWVDIPSESRTLTTDQTEVWEIDEIRYKDYRVYPTVTAGYMTVVAACLARI